MLEENGVERLVTSDYSLYGMLEVQSLARGNAPIAITHAWGDLSRRTSSEARLEALDNLLRGGRGGHYLVVTPALPLIYNLAPTLEKLHVAAERQNLKVEEVDKLDTGPSGTAILYAIR